MPNTMLLVVMGVGWTAPSLAGEPALEAEPLRTPRPVGKNLWRASLAAVTAVNVMNAGSSWGKRELNPNLSGNNGRFGAQGGLQAGNCREGGVLVVESLVLRRQPSTTKLYRSLALVNFGTASVTGSYGDSESRDSAPVKASRESITIAHEPRAGRENG